MMLTQSDIWKLQDAIKYHKIHFYEGDSVMLFAKRSDGYPSYLELGVVGIVRKVEIEHIVIDFTRTFGSHILVTKTKNGTSKSYSLSCSRIKLPKKYFADRSIMREIKLNHLLEGMN